MICIVSNNKNELMLCVFCSHGVAFFVHKHNLNSTRESYIITNCTLD